VIIYRVRIEQVMTFAMSFHNYILLCVLCRRVRQKNLPRLDRIERACRLFPHQQLGIVESVFESGVGVIAGRQRCRSVLEQSPPLGAFDGPAFEIGAELLVCQEEQVGVGAVCGDVAAVF
jgi:hypothetical protein